MQNRKPSHHDDMSVQQLELHHKETHDAEMQIALLEAMTGDTPVTLLGGIIPVPVAMLVDNELNDIHGLQAARKEELSGVVAKQKADVASGVVEGKNAVRYATAPTFFTKAEAKALVEQVKKDEAVAANSDDEVLSSDNEMSLSPRL